ncbi:Maf family protein [Dongia sedimenti]|uniref:Nucleoside triphosphate pyrophosphatase n=1 Tax=Dongia sedimenti TaxID=3064282 RepID=A0ABU0YL09_9PROT|nr:Maf family protein [Rhodospirillaceae bacterium R-7]
MPAPLILASASTARANMLRAAGVEIEIVPARVDESELKLSLKSQGADVETAAISLAELKAIQVSRGRPGRLVLGADQMLDCEGVWFDKPEDRAAARTQLLALRDKTHRLTSAAVLARDGQRVWHHAAAARLTMRRFTEGFLEFYLEQAGETVLSAVGAYQLEGLGGQMFRKIDGDFFTILGLPLLPVLDILREQNVLPR